MLQDNLEQCSGFQNTTAYQVVCPTEDKNNYNKSEILVVIHNTANLKNNQLSKVKLPHANFRAQVWQNSKFQDTEVDILEQTRF